jgi:tetratricopeptide (TPR) repeat protein
VIPHSLNCDFVRGRKVSVTGRMISMTHAELAELVTACGGSFLRYPRRCSFLLVIGQDGWPSEDDGSPSRVLARARRLRALGYAIEFLAEAEFLDRLGLSDPAGAIRGLLTVSDLTRILRVSARQVRRWVRLGLIEPAEQPCRLAYFDFRQVAFARRLCELRAAGASMSAIRDGIEKVRGWLSEQSLPLAQWARLESGGRVLTRLNDVLLDQLGQRYFDFDSHDAQSVAIAVPSRADSPRTADELFEQAIEREDAGQLSEAARVYQQAIALAPADPVLRFNLGNTYYGLRQFADAIDCFRCALEQDPRYAEAWNNLGSSWAAIDRSEEAIYAWREAVRLVPEYADAHANLADLLERLGRAGEAVEHRHAQYRFSAADRLERDRTAALKLFHETPDEGLDVP